MAPGALPPPRMTLFPVGIEDAEKISRGRVAKPGRPMNEATLLVYGQGARAICLRLGSRYTTTHNPRSRMLDLDHRPLHGRKAGRFLGMIPSSGRLELIEPRLGGVLSVVEGSDSRTRQDRPPIRPAVPASRQKAWFADLLLGGRGDRRRQVEMESEPKAS